MSVFCICACPFVTTDLEEIKTRLVKKAESLDIGVQFSNFFVEPIFDSFDCAFLINIADDFQFENCEHLLCSDGCAVDDEPPSDSLLVRMKKVQSLLKELSENAGDLHLFIGESMTGIDSFSVINCTIEELASHIVNAYPQSGSVPDLHLIISL